MSEILSQGSLWGCKRKCAVTWMYIQHRGNSYPLKKAKCSHHCQNIFVKVLSSKTGVGGTVGQTSRSIRSVNVATMSCQGSHRCTRQSEICGQSHRWRREPLALRSHGGSGSRATAASMSHHFRVPVEVFLFLLSPQTHPPSFPLQESN